MQVNPAKGGVTLSVSAQKPYELMSGETKLPVLSVECLHKNKKTSHLLIFLPGGDVAGPEGTSSKSGEAFVVRMNGTKHVALWVPYGDITGFVYFGKTEAERMQFIDSVLNSGTISIDFKPFLTGTPTTSVFDVSKLRDEMNKHPECSPQ